MSEKRPNFGLDEEMKKKLKLDGSASGTVANQETLKPSRGKGKRKRYLPLVFTRNPSLGFFFFKISFDILSLSLFYPLHGCQEMVENQKIVSTIQQSLADYTKVKNPLHI